MSDSLLVWNDACPEVPLDLSDDAYLLAEALELRKKLTVGEIRVLLASKNHGRAVNEVLERGLAFVSEQLEERYQPKMERFVFLAPEYEQDDARLNEAFEALEKAPKQSDLLLHFFQLRQQQQTVAAAALIKNAHASMAALRSLVTKGILRLEYLEADRLNAAVSPGNKTISLNEEQRKALEQIRQQWIEQPVVLLQGVTGSGKTIIYIELIREALAEGKQVLFLLPEIALTTHIVGRLRAFFGEELGVYHSRFSNNERVEIWRKVQHGDYQLVLGARSAVWLPFRDLGLVIVDEEHDASFKQYDPAPRFQARDSAIYLAQLSKAKTLLGSATPSLESAFNARQKKYGYASLKNRFGNVAMPQVAIVAAQNTQASLSELLTVSLLDAIQETLSKGNQVILFQNKRGYAPFLICAVCGHVPHCKNCDVSLTYHKASDKLHCHYCGQKTAPIKHCPSCGSAKVIAKSFGTEKIEEELQRIFPRRKIGRMDLDSMRGKNKHQQLIDDFEKGRLDILVGTQMVVKGLDFEHVGLVGILSADSLLSYPDFRVNERAFQLMEQVSGRAGRVDGKGQVIIQAYNLKQPVIQWVKDHDIRSFYQSELAYRQQFGYPPFSKIVKIICRHPNQEKAGHAATLLAAACSQIADCQVQGPGPALIPRIKSFYLFEIWLKLPVDAISFARGRQGISAAIHGVLAHKGFSSLQIIADVDPA
jgi:primosomal protein N' (replication factor Y)